jgi:hypothetical protein
MARSTRIVPALNHAKGRSNPHQNGAQVTSPGHGDDDSGRAGHQEQGATDRQHEARAEEGQLHQDGDRNAVGFEGAVAVRRIAAGLPDLVVVAQVPHGRDVEAAESDTVHQSTEASEAKRPRGPPAQLRG